MATVNVKFFKPAIVKDSGVAMGPDIATPEVFTSSGTSQASTATSADGNTYIRVVSTGGNVWLAFDASPTAVTGAGTLIVDGVPEFFKLEAGHKVALID
jgi:hypothetical protein